MSFGFVCELMQKDFCKSIKGSLVSSSMQMHGTPAAGAVARFMNYCSLANDSLNCHTANMTAVGETCLLSQVGMEKG